MKTYIKHNFTLLKGYSYTSKLLNNYDKYFSASATAATALAPTVSNTYNLLIAGIPGAGYKKYYHTHPVSKLEKILKKMNEKKLILPTPRENINSIFKANKINKVEIDKLLKFKRISNTSLLSKKFKTIKTSVHCSTKNENRPKPATFTAPDFKQDQTLISLANRDNCSLEKNIQNAGINNNKEIISLDLYQVKNAAVFTKKINLLKNLLYYNFSHINNKPYLFNNFFEAIFNNQVLKGQSEYSKCLCECKASNTSTLVNSQNVSQAKTTQGTLLHMLSKDRLPLPAYAENKQDSKHLLASIKARKLINKTKKSITSLTKTIPKTLINKKKIDPFKKRYVDYITLQIKRKLFYARMSKLVNRIKKKYKVFAYEAKIEALKIINTGKGSRLDFESILIEEKNRRGINRDKKIIKRPLPTINRKIENNSSKNTKIIALNNIKKIMKYNNNLIQKKEKNFILCSKNNILVTHVISKYNQMANKPKRKRNKRRGKLIKEKMRHRFYYPFLTKINIKGYLYTTSFIRYEDQVNILYKLYLAKILKYKFKYLSSFDYIMKNSKRSVNKRLSSAYGTLANRKRKAIDRTLVDSTLIKAMKKRIQKRIKKGKRSKRIIRFIDNYYRYVYPKNGIKFNLLKIPRYKWYTLKIRKQYINKRLKFALNKYKYNNKLNLNLLKNYKKYLHLLLKPSTSTHCIHLPEVSSSAGLVSASALATQHTGIKEIGSSNRKTKALLKKRIKKNYLIKTAVQRWLKLNTEKKLLKLHESAFNNYSFYTNLNSFVSSRFATAHEKQAGGDAARAFPAYESVIQEHNNISQGHRTLRENSSSISLEKKEFLKNFLINDWLKKENLVKDNYIFKNIKNELVSNYFLNKIFARKFKSFDSLSYEPKFLLDLLPSQMIDFFKYFAFHDSEALVSTLGKAVPASVLINTSIEYSVPIHFGTQMTINLFRNLIDKQKATKAKSKHRKLLTFSLKGNISNLAKYRKNKYKKNLYKNKLSVLLTHTKRVRKQSTSSYLSSTTIKSLQTGGRFLKLILNILLLKEIEKNNRFKFINTLKTLALTNVSSCANSLQPASSSKNFTNLFSISLVPSSCYVNKTQHTSLLPTFKKQVGGDAERLKDIKLKNIVKVLQKLNLLKKIKLIKKIKEIIYNKNKQFYLERLVKNFNVYNFREKINVLTCTPTTAPQGLGRRDASRLEKQAFLITNKSKAAIKKAKKIARAKTTKVKNIKHTASRFMLAQHYRLPVARRRMQRVLHKKALAYVLAAARRQPAASRFVCAFSTQSKKATQVKERTKGSGTRAKMHTFLSEQTHQQHLGLRKLLLKSKLKSLQHIQSNNKTLGREIITYNFNQNARRFNIFNSFDFTGSLVAFRRSHGLYLNISVLIKYFFKTIGGAIISKPLFIFNHNKITIKFFYYLSKNIYFFSADDKNKLLFLWLKNSKLEPDYSIINKYNILTKNPNNPFKWITLKNYSTNKALQKSYLTSISYKKLNQQHLLQNNIIASDALPASPRITRITQKHMREVRNKRKATKKAKLTKYFLRKNNILEDFKKEINAFTYILESYFNCSIQLEITRLKYPFYNSNILSQLIGLNGRKYGYEQVLKKLFPKIYIRNPKTTLTKYDLSPKRKKALVSYLSGIKLKIAGRFYRHKIIPKKTVNTYQRGSLQRGVINFVESSKYINKSKRGSFCITLTLSHIF